MTRRHSRRSSSGLLATPTGSVIYDQLARIVAEWQGVDTRVAHTYSSLLRLLLDDFAQRAIQRTRTVPCRPAHSVAAAPWTYVSLPVASVTPCGVCHAAGGPGRISRRAGHASGAPECRLPDSVGATAEGRRQTARVKSGWAISMTNMPDIGANGVNRQHLERQHGENRQAPKTRWR